MTTKHFSTIKCALSKCYCHGVSQEKQRFGTIFLSAPRSPPPQKGNFFFVVSLSLHLSPTHSDRESVELSAPHHRTRKH